MSTRRIRAWWHRATHALCPVCRTELHVGREWQEHKATHDRQEWRRALGLPPGSTTQT